MLVCSHAIPYDAHSDRSGEVQRQEFQGRVLAELPQRCVAYHVVGGDLDHRVTGARDILERTVGA